MNFYQVWNRLLAQIPPGPPHVYHSYQAWSKPITLMMSMICFEPRTCNAPQCSHCVHCSSHQIFLINSFKDWSQIIVAGILLRKAYKEGDWTHLMLYSSTESAISRHLSAVHPAGNKRKGNKVTRNSQQLTTSCSLLPNLSAILFVLEWLFTMKCQNKTNNTQWSSNRIQQTEMNRKEMKQDKTKQKKEANAAKRDENFGIPADLEWASCYQGESRLDGEWDPHTPQIGFKWNPSRLDMDPWVCHPWWLPCACLSQSSLVVQIRLSLTLLWSSNE